MLEHTTDANTPRNSKPNFQSTLATQVSLGVSFVVEAIGTVTALGLTHGGGHAQAMLHEPTTPVQLA